MRGRIYVIAGFVANSEHLFKKSSEYIYSYTSPFQSVPLISLKSTASAASLSLSALAADDLLRLLASPVSGFSSLLEASSLWSSSVLVSSPGALNVGGVKNCPNWDGDVCESPAWLAAGGGGEGETMQLAVAVEGCGGGVGGVHCVIGIITFLWLGSDRSCRSLAWACSRADRLDVMVADSLEYSCSSSWMAHGNMSSFFLAPTVDPGADVSFFLVPKEPNDQLSSLLGLAGVIGKGQSVLEKSDLEVRSVVEQDVRRRGGEENKPPVPPFALLLIPELEQEDAVEHVDVVVVVVEDDDDAVPFSA